MTATAGAAPPSAALARYNTLRDEGLSPDDAAAKVRSEFPEIEASPAKATVTAGPVTPAAPSRTLLDALSTPLRGAPVMAPADATSVASRLASPRSDMTIGAAPMRRPTDYMPPKPTLLDRYRQWREGNMERTLSAFDPKSMETPEGRDAILGLVMGLTDSPKDVAGAVKGAGKVVAGIGEKSKIPDLPVGPSVDHAVPGFQSPARRAAGTITDGHPLFAAERPRMFKDGDFDLSPEGRAHLEHILGPTGRKQVVTWDEAKALADELSSDPARILRNVRDLSGEEVLAVKQAIATDSERVAALSKIAFDPATTAEGKAAALQEIERRSNDLVAYASRVTKETSRTGRDLNLMKVMAKNTMDPAVWLVQATRMKGLPLAPEEAAQITRLATQRDREGLFDTISSLKRLDRMDKALTVWKAGLLTNPLTHLVNVTGNTAMAIMEQGKDAPAAVADLMLSLATGTRTKAMPTIEQATESVRGAVTNGYEAAKQVMRTGASPEELAKWDFRGGRFGKTMGSEKVGALLDLYTQTVFRSLGAEDQLFKAAAIGRSLDEQIRVEAMNIAKRTAKTSAPITAEEAETLLRQQVPDAMQAQALADAEFATFQNDNLVAGAVSAGKKYLQAKGPAANAVRAAVEANLPFVKTPTNVLERTFDYTPAGLLRAVAPAWKMATGADMAHNQRKVAEAFGRASIGSLAIWLGYEMAGKDMATGTMPSGAADEWDVRGRMAGSVRTSPEGDWHQVVRIQPLGTLIALGAQLRTIQDNAASASDVVGGSLATAGKLVADQPFLQGVQNIQEAISDPENKGGKWVRSTAASLVPAAVAAVAREVDATNRDPKTLADALKARIPEVSKSVPAKLNVFGREQSHASFPGAQMLDITRTRPNTETPALAELRRLGVRIGKPSQQVSVDGKTYALSPEEYAALLKQVGPDTERLLNAALLRAGYTRDRETPERTDLARRDMLRDAIDEARGRYENELARAIHRAQQEGSTEHPGALVKAPRRF